MAVCLKYVRISCPPPEVFFSAFIFFFLSNENGQLNESVYLPPSLFCHHRIRELIMGQQFSLLSVGSGRSH